MNIKIHYENLDNSPWMDQFVENQLNKLNRYLSQSASVQVSLSCDKNHNYLTSLAIHNPHHDYAFSTEGPSLYESMSLAIEKAVRALSEQKQIVKDKINRKLFSINKK